MTVPALLWVDSVIALVNKTVFISLFTYILKKNTHNKIRISAFHV